MPVVSNKTHRVDMKYLVDRLRDLEVGDAIIQRCPAWLLRDAQAAIGKAMRFQIDEETLVVTCTYKSAPTKPNLRVVK